jgi:hypothetical protein
MKILMKIELIIQVKLKYRIMTKKTTCVYSLDGSKRLVRVSRGGMPLSAIH